MRPRTSMRLLVPILAGVCVLAIEQVVFRRLLVPILAGVCVLAIEQVAFRPVVKHRPQVDAPDLEVAAEIALQNAVRRLGSDVDVGDVHVCEYDVADGARLRFVIALPTAAVDEGSLVVAWYRVEANRAGAILQMHPIERGTGVLTQGSLVAPEQRESTVQHESGA